MVVKLQPDAVLGQSRAKLGLPVSGGLDAALLAALIRRSAASLCPCSRATIRASICESLQGLTNPITLEDKAESGIEAALITGDLLELSQVTTVLDNAKGTWVFLAPPSFVRLPSGSILVMGVTQDHDEFLPQAIAARIQFVGTSRLIISDDPAELASELRDLGLHELSAEAWLRLPKQQSASSLIENYDSRLKKQSSVGILREVVLLDPTQLVRFYAGRWSPLKSQSGTYVARYPQEFGASMWGYAEVESGQIRRFLEMPHPQSKWRGCDEAWHLQMAIDCELGTPQVYRRSDQEDSVRFDFFSPLPIWAHRRLSVIGRSLEPNRSLLSYLVPRREATSEEEFFKERLFLRGEHADGGI